jgi:hypothetical protein
MKQGHYTMGKNQVYIIATLRHLQTQRIIITAVTHLKAKEGYINEKIRYNQAIQLCQTIHEADEPSSH